MRAIIYILLSLSFVFNSQAIEYENVVVGAERMETYLPLIKGKRVAVVANHTAVINSIHLVDTLISRGVNLIKIFAPEHGFRGTADAGSTIENSIDKRTGLPVVSLYGKNKKPTQEQLKGVDIVVFDIQDVGARFYTYISTMHLVMEACAEANIEFLVLDRPNPNGFYVDGPVLDKDFKSFIGMHPIPIVHGLTIAELATMINGEMWLKDNRVCNLKYVLCKGYTHNTLYKLPIKPSPNLPNMTSVFYYPTLCLLEGTVVSVGRGTEKPFQYVGHPKYIDREHSFTPESRDGARRPKWEGETCFGYDVNNLKLEALIESKKLALDIVLDTYKNTPKENFFRSSFNKLAGNSVLKKQIETFVSEKDIRESWQKDLETYKQMRRKYLLYPDFE